MNDDFWLSFIVWLPHRCQQCGTCEKGMNGTHLHSLPPVSVGGLLWLCGASVGEHGVWQWVVGGKWWEMHVDMLSMGGGYVEGCGFSLVWAEFPLVEFASILFRMVVHSWYVGHKISTYDTAFV